MTIPSPITPTMASLKSVALPPPPKKIQEQEVLFEKRIQPLENLIINASNKMHQMHSRS